MSRVLVCDPISSAGIDRLRAGSDVDVKVGLSPEALLECIGDYDAVIVRSETRITAEALARAGRLKVIGRAGVGVDNIDVRAATERGVIVVNSPQGNTIAAAELTLAMMLALARRIPQADRSLRAGKWERKRFVGTEVYGKTLGVVGLGNIGSEVARRARGLEMTVLAFDPFATDEHAAQVGARLVTLDDIWTQADFITLHLPLNDKTRGLIGPGELARMKTGVRIVNCARGGIADEEALADAVRSGKVAGIAFDVFTKEPPPPDHPLVALEEAVLTPHLGASTEEAQVNVAVDVAEQIAEVLAGRPARTAVNLPALSAEEMARARPMIQLAEKIGLLHTQLATDLDGRGRPIASVEILYQGEFGDLPTAPVTRSLLAGLLTPAMSEPVNLVNAPTLAAARGIQVSETHAGAHEEYTAVLTVKARMRDGERTISGTVFGQSDIRIVSVDGFRVDIQPEGVMIMTQHVDAPGVIGAVGSLLGNRGVNIAGMSVGRERVGGRALMVLMVDDPIDDEVLAAIRAVRSMETARRVTL